MSLPKLVAMLSASLLLAACSPSETPMATDVPSVEALAADSARLKELRQQCKTERSRLGDLLCNRVAEAVNRRFFGDGNTPYTPPKEPPKF